MKKFNLAIVQYGGITYSAMIDLALLFDKSRFNVFYFWCHPGKELFSSFEHIPVSQSYVSDQINKMTKAGVESVEFSVGKRFVPDPIMPWFDTDFFDKFKSASIDCIFTWRAGRPEYPYTHLNVPIVEWNIFGMADASPNLMRSLAISPLCKELYIKNGGESKKSTVQYVPVNISDEAGNLREKLSIPEDAIVCGMHQRPERGIFSPISINAIHNVARNTKKKIYFILLGGSELYSDHAKLVGLRNFIHLPYETNRKNIDIFLNTLDIYTHSRCDGETLGRVLQEAMIHKLPIISHTAQWNAHIETIGAGGRVVSNERDYSSELLAWINNREQARSVGLRGYAEAIRKYSSESAIKMIQNQIIEAISDWRAIPDKVKNRHIKLSKNINYLYLIRFFAIQFYNKLMVLIFGSRGSAIVLYSQQFFNRTKRLLRTYK